MEPIRINIHIDSKSALLYGIARSGPGFVSVPENLPLADRQLLGTHTSMRDGDLTLDRVVSDDNGTQEYISPRDYTIAAILEAIREARAKLAARVQANRDSRRAQELEIVAKRSPKLGIVDSIFSAITEEYAQAERDARERVLAEVSACLPRALVAIAQAEVSPGSVFEMSERLRFVVSQTLAYEDERELRAVREALLASNDTRVAISERVEAIRAHLDQDARRAHVAALAERDLWIAEHGSRRLQLMLAAERPHEEIQECYVDERVTQELPGWIVLREDYSVRDALHPSEDAMLSFVEAKAKCVELRISKLTLDYIIWHTDAEDEEPRKAICLHALHVPTDEAVCLVVEER